MKKLLVLLLIFSVILIGSYFFKYKNGSTCENLLERINILAISSNYCDVDDECYINREYNGCGLGCYLVHNKNENVDELMGLVNIYKKECSAGCFKDCALETKSKFHCKDNKCVKIE